MYVASSLQPGSITTRRVALPDGSRPWDLIVRDGQAYILLEKPEEQGCSVRVLVSKDLQVWSELFRFHAATFARSFELLDGAFYFGLGCEIQNMTKWSQTELAPETGNIVRLNVNKRLSSR